MPLLSDIAQRKKINFFLKDIAKDAHILEVGSGSGWVGEYFRKNGYGHYTGLDIVPPAGIVGDINQWRSLGLQPNSFDVIIAFEVVEHVDLLQSCYDLLKPGGRLMMTSPVPYMDFVMKTLEVLGLNQKRTSPHSNLTSFSSIVQFPEKYIRTIAFLSQWGVFTKPASV